jgi:hypothetical protein
MSPRRTQLPALLLVAALILAALTIPLAPAVAQTAEVTATEAPATTPGATPIEATLTLTVTSTPGTPTATPTPTLTPTATPTLTALQAQLVLANAYLEGKDYAHAAALFAAIAELDRGNAEALAGLKAALDGQAAATATAMAPTPTPEPPATPAPPKVTAMDAAWTKLADYGSTIVAGLLAVVLVYLLASAFRWLLYWLRELWLTRVRVLLRRSAILPGFLIGEFANGLEDGGANVPGIVSQALSEKLVMWNRLVHAKEVPVEPAPTLDLGGMGWLKILWSWILPPLRGYKVTGALLQSPTGAYQLSVQRTDLAHNRVDMSTTLEKRGASPETVFRAMAGEAAKWLVTPADMEASAAVVRGMRAVRGIGEEAMSLTPSEIFDQALELLLPVRQQVNQGAIDFGYARKQLQDAEALLSQLPEGSQLRRDVQDVITDLRRAVPAG